MRAFLAAIHRQEAGRQLARLDMTLLLDRALPNDLMNFHRRLERAAKGKD